MNPTEIAERFREDGFVLIKGFTTKSETLRRSGGHQDDYTRAGGQARGLGAGGNAR